MTPLIILLVIVLYFLFLMVIAHFTKGKGDNEAFFSGNRNSKWYLVAFGMIGASLSGVTFISVPGAVGPQSFAYMQMVLGYLVGYTIIATVLIPVFYKLNVVSIYSFLGKRFGTNSHKTGSAFFLLSRIVGASFRLFLVAGVMQAFVFDYYNIPFIATITFTVFLIWVYTFQGGIKTIVITDTLQTFFMLAAVVLCIYFVLHKMNFSLQEAWQAATFDGYTKTFFFDELATNKLHFVKQFFSGALIALVMTGLDQDMMQKNLTCSNIKDAQKNVFSMSIALIPVNLLFLFLGALLYLFAAKFSLAIPERIDYLFPEISFNQLPLYVGIIFLLGLVAAAYSSADSALTSLTTAFCVDFLGMDKKAEAGSNQTRFTVHLVFSVIIIAVVFLFDSLGNESVVNQIFKFAGYTYGPILGLFAFGLLNKRKVRDKAVPVICVFSPLLTWYIGNNSFDWFGYTFGFELLLLNGLITFIGLYLLSLGQTEKIDIYANEDGIEENLIN